MHHPEKTAGLATRLPGFYKLPIAERLRRLHQQGLLNQEDFQALLQGEHQLTLPQADNMIENVIGVQGLPLGLGLNFLINEKEYVVPLTVEEPSIVAALSSAAKLVHDSGGFQASSTRSILIGQIQLIQVPHLNQAKTTILQRKEEVISLANSLHPNMVARGGGALDLEVHLYPQSERNREMLVVHLLVDTCDAMGANLVNTMCEGVASLLESMAGGQALLRILSNLCDRSLVTARMVIPVAKLAGKGRRGEEVRDGIIMANELAVVDPYRACTHNKGVMNGIDAVAIATGNDWRAIEAAAHAYAARGKSYSSLTRWYQNEQGDLVGELELPLTVGTVGGSLRSNPTVGMNLRLLGIESSRELAEVMAAVGIAQNFSALRALVTDGIQQGHMSLHARSVAMTAGASGDFFEPVVEALLESGEIKVWKAKEILAQLQGKNSLRPVGAQTEEDQEWSIGYGKIILLGEHAVVYGRHAIAMPIPLTMAARIERLAETEQGVTLSIPRWGIEQRLNLQAPTAGSFVESIAMLIQQLGLEPHSMIIRVRPEVPRAMGLGSSAALAVAIVRALSKAFDLNLSEQNVSDLAFECEKIAHGTPSGIDNTVATFGQPLLYHKAAQPELELLELSQSLPLVIGLCNSEGFTAQTVANVRQAWQKNPQWYERIFDGIEALTQRALVALKEQDLSTLGEMMNICHGQLNALQVSSWELEEMVHIARSHGALGAKLTGGGGGGAMIALCPDNPQQVMSALQQAGYHVLGVNLE